MRIERNIPVPESAVQSGKGSSTYPFARMEVGDSFSLPEAKAMALIEAAKKWRQRHSGWEHAHHREGGTIRLWRVA